MSKVICHDCGGKGTAGIFKDCVTCDGTGHLDKPGPITEPTLNLEHDPGFKARALHRIVRSMHDGHCPRCGNLEPAEDFYEPPRSRLNPPLVKAGIHQCSKCFFTITDEEAEAALAEFRPYLQKSVEIFEQWRAERATR